jgi:hypothetical protein
MHFGTPSAERGICTILCCLGVWLCGAIAVPAQIVFGQTLDDATMEDYHGVQLASRIHITRAYIDHEKFGFFKIALAPVPVVEGVRMEIRSAGSLTNILQSLGSWNVSSANLRHLEFRNLEISLLSDQSPRLRAEKARLVQPNVLELSHVSLSSGPQGSLTISRATLQVSGPDCGLLNWNNAGNHEEWPVFKP